MSTNTGRDRTKGSKPAEIGGGPAGAKPVAKVAAKPVSKPESASGRANRAPATMETKEQTMNNGNDTFADNTRRMIEHGNKNAEALIEASKIAAGGAEEIAQELARYLGTSMEDGLATSQALLVVVIAAVLSALPSAS